MDADSSDLPQVIRCSADRMSENGVYLLGEFILNQVLHDHQFCGRVKKHCVTIICVVTQHSICDAPRNNSDID